jgi:membrane fusion protein (multidrug efflux system)
MFKRKNNNVASSAAGTAEASSAGEQKGPRLVVAEAPAVAPPVVRAPVIEAPNQSPAVEGKDTGKKTSKRRLVLIPMGLLLVAVAGWYGHHYWTVGRFEVSTDDAYVGAHTATLAAKIPGYLISVDVADNAAVREGDVVARIDDGDYRLAVEAAKDNVAIARATVARIGKQVEAQQAAVAQAEAQLASAEAGAVRAEQELSRQKSLEGKEFASRQALEQAQANRDQAVAGVAGAKAAVRAATANVAVLKAQVEEAERTLKQYETALDKAERDFSFTVIKAPFAGIIGNRAVHTGDYVQPGQRLASLVPLDEVYIDANFKETQVSNLHPGQTATISIDALPDHDITGRLVSVAPASGSVFSLLPPDNATGNFTKIVQRIPVRIEVPASIKTAALLRPGMSVVVTVNTKVAKTAGSHAAVAGNTR